MSEQDDHHEQDAPRATIRCSHVRQYGRCRRSAAASVLPCPPSPWPHRTRRPPTPPSRWRSAGGNAVDAALAAALVAMVNEVGIVSLSSGGFVTVQPGDGGPAYTVDGWMDMPGRGHAPGPAGAADVGRVDGVRRRRGHHHRAGLGRGARVAGGVRRGPPARRAAAVARDRRAGGRGRPRRLPADLGGALLPRLHLRRHLRLGRGEPGRPPRRRGRADHRADRDAGPRRLARADRERRTGSPAHRRAGRADQPRRDRPRRAAHARRPGGVPARRTAGARLADRTAGPSPRPRHPPSGASA